MLVAGAVALLPRLPRRRILMRLRAGALGGPAGGSSCTLAGGFPTATTRYAAALSAARLVAVSVGFPKRPD
jgi:hypothetical protein